MTETFLGHSTEGLTEEEVKILFEFREFLIKHVFAEVDKVGLVHSAFSDLRHQSDRGTLTMWECFCSGALEGWKQRLSCRDYLVIGANLKDWLRVKAMQDYKEENGIKDEPEVTDTSTFWDSSHRPIFRAKEPPVADMLEERGARYGDFCGHAKITMDLKRAMHASKNWETLSDDKKECLDMVAHKIGRILNGDPEYKDSWDDCIGYLTLVTNKLKEAQDEKR